MLEAFQGLTKTGEGYGRPGGESNLPIDINYAKLVEWLVRSAITMNHTDHAFGATVCTF